MGFLMTRDLRKYSKQTSLRLILGFIVLLFTIGEGLIYIIYGRQAAIMGLICLLGAAIPVLLVIISLWVIDRISKVNDRD